ncbi:MAG: hypothetical protein WDA68_08580 [Phycisphaerae bacterium]
MRLRDYLICSIMLLLAVGFMIISGGRLDYIHAQRKQMNLVINEPLENAPPSLAFATVALGAFRGLIVDILWLRADRLKEQGQFFEAKQLAEWIGTLQPRFGAVWSFQAWNMAYNISVAIPASQPEQRWRWVKNGYELLRDRGIHLNPGDIGLYRELAWIFLHKIGGITDDAHEYYKLQLAKDMQLLLGSADREFFDALVAAPQNWSQVIKDEDVARFVNALKSVDTIFEDERNFVSNYLALRQNPSKFKPETFRVIDDFRGTPAISKFDIFAKAYQLRNVWKLEPAMMLELNNRFGPADMTDPNIRLPLEWRHPAVHAMYWAIRGLEVNRRTAVDADEANTDRIISHALQDLYRSGKIFIYRQAPQDRIDDRSPGMAETIYLRPDLRMFDSYNEWQLSLIEKYTDRPGTYDSMKLAHRNMMQNAVLAFYQAGYREKALQIYNELRKNYLRDEFRVDLASFVRNRFREEVQSLTLNDAREIIQLMLRESYFRYALHDDDEAYVQEKTAEDVYRLYMSTVQGEEHRLGMPEFSMLRYLAVIDFLQDYTYPESLRNSLRARIRHERPQLSELLEKQEEIFIQRLQQEQQRQQPLRP